MITVTVIAADCSGVAKWMTSMITLTLTQALLKESQSFSFSKDYSAYKTALRATSSMLHHDRRHYLYSTIYIGYWSRVGYATNYAAWCTESTTTLFLRTYPNCVYPAVTLVSDLPLGETTLSLEHIDT